MRYTYWRRPDTRLEQQDDNAAPIEILKYIGETARSADGISLQWQSVEIIQLEDCLKASIAIKGADGRILNEYDAASIVSRATSLAIHECGIGKPIRPSILRKHLEKLAAEYYAKEMQQREFVTSFSLAAPIPSCYSIRGLKLQPCNRADYPLPSALTATDSCITPHISKSRYMSVKVTIPSVTAYQAFEDGQEACDLILGIWNHMAGYSFQDVFDSVPTRHYVARIHPSPISTVHESNGISLDVYSYRREYFEDVSLYRATQSDWAAFHSETQRRLDLIEASPIREELVTLFCRYTNAIVHPDHAVVFMMLWSILERITGTVGSSYEELTKRAAWPFADHLKNVTTLRVCQLRRNLYVHSAQSGERQLQFCYMLKRFVDAHLRILLANRFRISSLREYGELLSLPRDSHVLEDKLQKYRKALRYHHEDIDYSI